MRDWIERAVRLQVPYFGHDDSYYIGSGLVGASGNASGEWTFAIGPDLTSPNFLSSETICLGDYGPLPFRMHRLRGCGAFFGIASLPGLLRATVTEACPPGSACILRLLTLENESSEQRRFDVAVCVRQDGTEVRASGGSIEIIRPEGVWCFGNQETRNWAQRRLRVRVPDAAVATVEESWRLSVSLTLPSGSLAVVPIWHDFAYGEEYAAGQDAIAFLKKANQAWGLWLAAGKYPSALSNRHLRDAVEALLLNVRMQQNRDGGMIAGIRKYANSYIRDTHGGMRLLNACGHAEDTARLLENIHTRWEIAGYIPNWWSMGSDTFIGDSFENNASEITAYYIFMLRDYLAAGGDESLARRILPSIRWAADTQAKYLLGHDLLMNFNGDETEQYCVNRDGEEYGLFGSCHSEDRLGFDKKAPSFASTIAAAGSLAWFASHTGESRYAELAERVYARADTAFWDGERGRHGWILDGAGLRKTLLTNAVLLPLWLHIPLPQHREIPDAIAALRVRSDDTGYMPNCPGVSEGFCGHTLGLALYCASELDLPEADDIAETILCSNLLSRFGTISEFYGPGGTPNGHGNRPFEGGIVGEALIHYALKKGE